MSGSDVENSSRVKVGVGGFLFFFSLTFILGVRNSHFNSHLPCYEVIGFGWYDETFNTSKFFFISGKILGV